MSRTLGALLAAHIATRRTELARCVRLDLRDGSSIGITDHDADLAVDLGDGSLAYSAAIGAAPSAVALSLGLEADNVEIAGPLVEPFTAAAVAGGRFHRARVRVFDVRWSAPAQFARLLSGKVSSARIEADAFTLEVRSAADAFNQTIGRVLSPQCSNDFGVYDLPRSYCQAVPATWAATVSAVTDDLRFAVTWTGLTPTVETIRNGLAAFDTGSLAGGLPVEVFNLAGATVELYQPLVEAPQVGDTLTVTQGCAKTREACKSFGQILNFRGFPDLVGTDDYVKFPSPGG